MDTTQNTRRNIAERAGSDDRAAALREQVGVVGEDVRQLASTAGEAALEFADPIEEYIREKPFKSMLIAAGAGIVFSMLFLRR